MQTAEIIKLVLKSSLVLMALGFGLKATLAEALYLFRKPGLLLRSVLAMNLLMPTLAVLMAVFLPLQPLVKVTLLAISVSPLAPIFPRKTLKAGGREAYVIGLMLMACLLSVILIPLTLEIMARIFKEPVAVNAKALVLTALTSVVLPLSAGLLLHRFTPSFSEKIAGKVTRFSQVLLLVSLLPIIIKMLPAIIHLIGNGTVLAIAAFVVAGVFIGHFLGGPAEADRTVLALATASRHPAIAISVASANLHDHHLVPAAILLYLLINAVVALPYLKWLRHDNKIDQAIKRY